MYNDCVRCIITIQLYTAIKTINAQYISITKVIAKLRLAMGV
jgi:hypothetical protein